MNEQKDKNILTKIILIIIVISSIFLLTINFIPIFVVDAGIERRFSDNIYSDSEAYVCKDNPDTNMVGREYISNSSEIFVHFNLEKIPMRTEEFYFFLYEIDPPLDDIEINIILVDSNWTSSKITWNNKPKHEEIIATVNISDIIQYPYVVQFNFEKAVNMTELLKGGVSKEISICLNITENNEKSNLKIYIYQFNIIWTYEKIILSYTPIITTLFLLPLVIVMIYFLGKDLRNCRECGSKRVLKDKYCTICGSAFKEKILVKSLDYQLILIILSLFVFLEVTFISIILALTNGIIGILIIPPAIVFWVKFCLKRIKKKINEYKKLNSNLKQA